MCGCLFWSGFGILFVFCFVCFFQKALFDASEVALTLLGDLYITVLFSLTRTESYTAISIQKKKKKPTCFSIKC